ncbi:hypothetical protein WR25_14046 [Diploscapter pachys]|uniref:Uncharacterized protein n=1 Tax=Diploscapter pachys TaxID=2018661 RepID=A0A2A2JH37_9BILA|nr:hypothetical protein WR25_14046 [Diploscapter pachys]
MAPLCESCGYGVNHHPFMCPLTEVTLEPKQTSQEALAPRAPQQQQCPVQANRAFTNRSDRPYRGQRGGRNGGIHSYPLSALFHTPLLPTAHFNL